MPACVHYQRHHDIGVIRIDNPPVNALSQAVRSGLVEALDRGLADDAASVLVLMAEGRTFIAGADIREFGKPPEAPLLPAVIARLEASTKPIVAALHGTALGGGLEVALGCQVRVALPGTRVGLPEVKLGLLPGAGGTQRLPRLVGITAALDMITSGRFVKAEEALALGIIDVISDHNDVLGAGLATARDVINGKRTARVTGELPPPAADHDALASYRTRLENDVPELFSPFRCVDAVAASAEGSFEEGLRRERELFLSCMDSPQRAGLIHAFFAARGPHKVPEATATAALTRIAMVGEHPLFERLRANAERAGILLNTTPEADSQACLVAPGGDTAACPSNCLRVAIVEADDTSAADDQGASLVLVTATNGALVELVTTGAEPHQQQALADALKALRQSVVVSRRRSMLTTLHQASRGVATEQLDSTLQDASRRIAADGLCYRTSDIDLLAIEALGYPRHLGGPHRQAELARTPPRATPETPS